MTHPVPRSDPPMSDPDIPEIAHAFDVAGASTAAVLSAACVAGFVASGAAWLLAVALAFSAVAVAIARDPEAPKP